MNALKRFQVSDLSARRVYEAVVRRVVDIPDALAWRGASGFAHENKERLARFAGKHSGERCFILGNGPSLAAMDLSPLEQEFTFGTNRIYLYFDKMGFATSYFVSINELVLEQFGKDIGKLPMPKFLNWNRRALFGSSDESIVYVNLKYSMGDTFEEDIRRPLSGGGTVTYVALQIAFFMGFQEVILIGVDHNFSSKGTPNTTALRRTGSDKDHFLPNYLRKRQNA